jgi:hypothetical protein
VHTTLTLQPPLRYTQATRNLFSCNPLTSTISTYFGLKT